MSAKTGQIIRWVVAVLCVLALTVLVSSPSLGEVKPLELDQLVPGQPTRAEDWRKIDGDIALTDEYVLSFGTAQPYVLKYDKAEGKWSATEEPASPSEFKWQYYEDESITVRCEYATVQPADKNNKIPASVTYIKIADPTQIRTAMSRDSYKGAFASAEDMAKHVNAVAAVDGDFFKYHGKVGYVVRQGEFYRDKLDGSRDLLLIDENGDFHRIYAATSEETAAYIEGMNGLKVINTFTLGPVLAENGTARVIKDTITAQEGELQWKYAQQRVAVLQTGTLEYAIVEVYGKTDSSRGVTLQEFADLIVYLFPECRIAYNLDGGGSTNVVLDGKRIHKTPGRRDISDILYFASARAED